MRNSRAASNMARLLSVAAIVLLLLGSSSLTVECRHLRLAGERGTGVASRRLLVGRLRSPPICSLWGLGNCTTGGRRKSSDVAAASIEHLSNQHDGPSIGQHSLPSSVPSDTTFRARTVCLALQTQRHRMRPLPPKAARRLLRRKPPRTGLQTPAMVKQQRRSQTQRASSLQLRRNLPQRRAVSPPAVQ